MNYRTADALCCRRSRALTDTNREDRDQEKAAGVADSQSGRARPAHRHHGAGTGTAQHPCRHQQEKFWTHSDGTKFHYFGWGTGTPVIVIHGWGGTALNWMMNGLGASLAKTNRVLAGSGPDMTSAVWRGAGRRGLITGFGSPPRGYRDYGLNEGPDGDRPRGRLAGANPDAKPRRGCM
jgi:hypothetical protein